jgi:murein DD-endopeptidase MepM/ murein hydrolase activator NlpD
MPRSTMRVVVALVVALAGGVLGLLAAEPVLGHESDCHAQQTCPSDDHSYVWSDGTAQLDCGLMSASGGEAEGTTIIEYDGQRYACYAVGEQPPPTTTEPEPEPPPPPETTVETTLQNPVAEEPPPKEPSRKRKARSEREAPLASSTPPVTQVTFPQVGGAVLPAGRYVFPVDGPASFTNDFGAARATTGWHHGIDIFAPLGTPVIAVTAGTVLKVGWNGIGGNRLWLRDRKGNFFYYAHLAGFAPNIENGARVPAGALLGYLGNTGDAVGTPYHLHFEIHPASLTDLGYDGVVNPFPYLRRWPRLDDLVAGRARLENAPPPPAPGAILLTASDISSASGLEPKTLVESVQAPVNIEAALKPLLHLEAVRREAPPRNTRAAALAALLDKSASSPFDSPGPTVWDALAECESGGDWHARTENGFFGGLQFHPGTWLTHGGGEFAPSAHLATREQQILIARRTLEAQGWAAWPVCSLRLGLR